MFHKVLPNLQLELLVVDSQGRFGPQVSTCPQIIKLNQHYLSLRTNAPNAKSLRRQNKKPHHDGVSVMALIMNANQATLPQKIPKRYYNSNLRDLDTHQEAKLRSVLDNCCVICSDLG